jgi:hypothetical protein
MIHPLRQTNLEIVFEADEDGKLKPYLTFRIGTVRSD